MLSANTARLSFAEHFTLRYRLGYQSDLPSDVDNVAACHRLVKQETTEIPTATAHGIIGCSSRLLTWLHKAVYASKRPNLLSFEFAWIQVRWWWSHSIYCACNYAIASKGGLMAPLEAILNNGGGVRSACSLR
jgi:hypothetical protein